MKTRSTYRVAKEELNFQFTLQEQETKCCICVAGQKRSGFSIPLFSAKRKCCRVGMSNNQKAGCSLGSSETKKQQRSRSRSRQKRSGFSILSSLSVGRNCWWWWNRIRPSGSFVLTLLIQKRFGAHPALWRRRWSWSRRCGGWFRAWSATKVQKLTVVRLFWNIPSWRRQIPWWSSFWLLGTSCRWKRQISGFWPWALGPWAWN